ncbi:MAG: hypothetical protein ACFCVE_00810 [Phycisphaerae bacterium]
MVSLAERVSWRSFAAQATLWGVLGLCVLLALAVSRYKTGQTDASLGEPVSLGALVVRPPAGWQTEVVEASGVWQLVAAERAEPALTGPGRVLVVRNVPFAEPVSDVALMELLVDGGIQAIGEVQVAGRPGLYGQGYARASESGVPLPGLETGAGGLVPVQAGVLAVANHGLMFAIYHPAGPGPEAEDLSLMRLLLSQAELQPPLASAAAAAAAAGATGDAGSAADTADMADMAGTTVQGVSSAAVRARF